MVRRQRTPVLQRVSTFLRPRARSGKRRKGTNAKVLFGRRDTRFPTGTG